MAMQMEGYPRSRRATEVEADITTVGLEGLLDDLLAFGNGCHEVAAFFFRQIFQFGHRSIGNRQQMPGIVGKLVEYKVIGQTSPNDESFPVIIGLMQF